jgi:excisionase family DNA binding protein
MLMCCQLAIDEICKTLNVSRATLYRYINTGKKAE